MTSYRSADTSPCAACASTMSGAARSAGCGIGRPSTTSRNASSSSVKPCPPASTTPASRRTGSISGVWATAWRAAAAASSSRSTSVVAPLSRAPSAASAAQRTTVRIVPSTGRITAWYAASAAVRSAVVTSAAATCSTSRNVSARPRRIWLRITPELPRAPISDPWAIAWQTSGIAWADPSSCTTDSRVRVMFVPVSPSGTG